MRYLQKIFAHSKVRSAFLLIIALACFLSLITYTSTDISFNLVTNNEPNNILLYFGSYLSDLLYQLLGVAAFIIPICTIAWSYSLYCDGQIKCSLLKFLAMITSIIFFSSGIKFTTIYYLPTGAGGLVSIPIWYLSKKYFPILVNEQLFSLICITISILFLFLALGIRSKTYKKAIVIIFAPIVILISKMHFIKTILQKIISLNQGQASYTEEKSVLLNKKYEQNNSNIKKSNLSKKKIDFNSTNKNLSDSSIQNDNFGILPSIDLLDRIDSNNIKPQSQSELQEKAELLLSVLKDFGVKGQINDICEGPVVTMYEFEPAAGTKSSRVIGLADDIARSLSAISTRIAVMPGKNALGIELPNKKRMFFRLRDLLQTKEFQNNNILLPIILGKDLGGNPLIADLAKMPHLLVAGTTGSGKSVAINTMIMSLLYRYTPKECRMIMIDPKMLELSAYDNIPHLMTPVVTEPGKAVIALKWAVKEMETRYKLMSYLGVRSIANYNSRIQEAINNGEVLERKVQTGFDPETGKPLYETTPIEMVSMPFIVVVVDEMADLMLVAGKDIETSIQRLAQMARAAGIHIIMATQRPSVDVITGVIKANFPSRISFKVTSKIDSRTILGEQGAEQLLGMGDMLYMGNSSRILRVHGPFVEDKEVEKVTNFLRQTGNPEYVSAVTESNDEEVMLDSAGSSDNMYSRAINIVKKERKSSISYIQRSLRIGYNRAANLVEEMEKKGVLSEPNYSGKREILLPEE